MLSLILKPEIMEYIYHFMSIALWYSVGSIVLGLLFFLYLCRFEKILKKPTEL